MSIRVLAVAGVVVGLGARPSFTPHTAVPAGSMRISSNPCEQISQPKKLPSVNVWFDSTALVQRLQALPVDTSDVVISIQYSDLPNRRIMNPSSPTPAQDSLADIVLGALRQSLKDVPPAFRVKVRRTPQPALALDRAQLCGPISLDGPSGKPSSSVVVFKTGTRVVNTRTGASQSIESTPKEITTRILIGATGEVIDADVGAGSGINAADRSMRENLLNRQYKPALLDGRPVSVWLVGTHVELAK